MLINQSGENGQNAQTVLYDAHIVSHIQATSPLSHKGSVDLCRIKHIASALGITGGHWRNVLLSHSLKKSQLFPHLVVTKFRQE